MNTIKLACQVAGGQAALARALGLSPAAVNQWASGTRPIPIRHCQAIERVTGGAVTRKDLRPSDWQDIWPELVGPLKASDGRLTNAQVKRAKAMFEELAAQS